LPNGTDWEKIGAVSLVKSWLHHFTGQGLPKKAALVALNKATGRSYEHGHLSRWERGKREPDAKARAEMMHIVLADEYPNLAPREIRRLLE
jgi:hypothetical protein